MKLYYDQDAISLTKVFADVRFQAKVPNSLQSSAEVLPKQNSQMIAKDSDKLVDLSNSDPKTKSSSSSPINPAITSLTG